MNQYDFFVPTRVLFGQGKLQKLHKLPMPGKKALLVTSNGQSAVKNGSLAATKEELEKAGCSCTLFNKVAANPLKEVVEEGARCARDNGCDFVVALGGGSVMDAAKNMAMFAPQPSDDLWDYVFSPYGGKKKLTNPPLPWIAITTSAGTGSEVDAGGVITNTKTKEKIGVGFFPGMFATYAIVDPELMRTVPPKFTAYQGFDALFHSLEGYISNTANPMAEMVQRAAIEKIGAYLPRAVANGNDMEARNAVAFANTMSGYSMVASSCISEHSIEHALSAYHPELPHGAGLIMLSIEYFRYWINRHVCDDRFVDLARYLGRTDASRPEDFIDALYDLQKACGVADLKMSDYGIAKEEARTLAQNAMSTMGVLFRCDPAEMSEDDCTDLIRRAWK
jgi:alcohol dehydrogenase